jgi:hypothetical protein
MPRPKRMRTMRPSRGVSDGRVAFLSSSKSHSPQASIFAS